MESYRNNNNNQQSNSGYPNTGARASYYLQNTNTTTTSSKKKQRKKNQVNNENNFNNRNLNNAANRNQLQNNSNQNTNDFYANQEMHSLPTNFINNYVTNLPSLPTEMSSSYDASSKSQQPQQYLTNHNRSPQRHYNNRFNNGNRNNNKKFVRSSSNHNMKENNKMNNSNSFDYSPRKGVRSSPSDPAISSHLVNSGEFNSILTNLRNSPQKLTPTIEERKLTVTTTTSRDTALTTPNMAEQQSGVEISQQQPIVTTTQKTDVKIHREEVTAQYDAEMNATVVNTLNVSLENSEIQIEKEYDIGSIKSADQSEISENNYFSANETNQAQSCSSSSSSALSTASSATTSPSRNVSSASSTSYLTSTNDNDDSLVKCDDTVNNKTINNEMMNNSEVIVEKKEEEEETTTKSATMSSNIDFIESEGDYYPHSSSSSNNQIINNANDVINNVNEEEEEASLKKELEAEEAVASMNINTQLNNDSINSTSSTNKTITSNISDIELDTNGSSKSSAYSDLENLKIRTIDIESDENPCDSSANEDNKQETEVVDEVKQHQQAPTYDIQMIQSKAEQIVKETLEKECSVEAINEEVLKTELMRNFSQSKVTDLAEAKNEEHFDDNELKEIVERIVAEVITNALTIIVQPEAFKIKHHTVEAVETEKITIDFDSKEEDEIIDTKIHEIEPLKTHSNDEDDFDLCQDSDLEQHKYEINLMETATATLNKNEENGLRVEYTNKSLLDEINQNEDEQEQAQQKTTAVADVTTISEATHNETTKSTKQKSSSKKVTTSEVDCFGCQIL